MWWELHIYGTIPYPCTTIMPSTTTTMTALPSTIDVLATPCTRAVRFDTKCVLIPDTQRSKRPKMVTKSYSLPLWKKRSPDSDLFPTTGTTTATTTEDTHLTFKVPVLRYPKSLYTRLFLTPANSFSSKPRSQSHGRGAPHPTHPLPSCLVNSDSPSPITPHRQPTRSPSLPLPPRPSPTTVPLRACCTDCVLATEESLKVGPLWQEKFSRGARRKRSASFDTASACTPRPHAHSRAGSGASFPEPFTLTVDEVDKRRRSQEYTSSEDGQRLHAHDASTSSTSSTSASISTCATSSRKSPIPEEDEDQLFPLPSPRRSPTASPNTSPNASPIPTPNTSTASLTTPFFRQRACKAAACASASRDSLPVSAFDEGGSAGCGGNKRLVGKYVHELPTPDPSPPVPAPTRVPASLASPSLNPHSPVLLHHSLSLPRAPSPPVRPIVILPAPTQRNSNIHATPSRPHLSLDLDLAATTFAAHMASTACTPPIAPTPPSSPPALKKRPSFGPGTLLKAGAGVLKGVGSMSVAMGGV